MSKRSRTSASLAEKSTKERVPKKARIDVELKSEATSVEGSALLMMTTFKLVKDVEAFLTFKNLSFKRHTDRKANPYIAFYDASGKEVSKEFVTDLTPEEIKALITKKGLLTSC